MRGGSNAKKTASLARYDNQIDDDKLTALKHEDLAAITHEKIKRTAATSQDQMAKSLKISLVIVLSARRSFSTMASKISKI
jgi:hypothetical protein